MVFLLYGLFQNNYLTNKDLITFHKRGGNREAGVRINRHVQLDDS